MTIWDVVGFVLFALVVASCLVMQFGGPSRWNMTDAEPKRDDVRERRKLSGLD
jgi:hypothetical protein